MELMMAPMAAWPWRVGVAAGAIVGWNAAEGGDAVLFCMRGSIYVTSLLQGAVTSREVKTRQPYSAVKLYRLLISKAFQSSCCSSKKRACLITVCVVLHANLLMQRTSMYSSYAFCFPCIHYSHSNSTVAIDTVEVGFDVHGCSRKRGTQEHARVTRVVQVSQHLCLTDLSFHERRETFGHELPN